MRILISGAGIAGPTLAFWLLQHGFDVTIVERAPVARTGGYVIDFWGAGFDVAERMGLLPEVMRRGYQIQEVRIVDASGRTVGGFPVSGLEEIVGGRFTSLPRGELAQVIIDALPPEIFRFGDGITALQETSDGVEVQFEHAPPERFDLVVGADGLHSRVRSLAFGPAEGVEKFLRHYVAVFEVTGYPVRDEDVYLIFTEVGQQVARFTMREDRTVFLFIFAEGEDTRRAKLDDVAAQKALIQARFAKSGWECPAILELLRDAPSLYFDRVSQIRAERWTQGRVALVGDAAACPSFLAGQGSALAMVEAYVLAGELARSGKDHATAFAAYERTLRDFVAKKQRGAERMAGTFVPRSRAGLFLRNQLSKLLKIPLFAKVSVARGLRDPITLPDYHPVETPTRQVG